MPTTRAATATLWRTSAALAACSAVVLRLWSLDVNRLVPRADCTIKL